MDMTNIINKMLVLLILLLVGYIANKAKILDESRTRGLTTLVLNITQSALILGAIMTLEEAVSPMKICGIMLLSFGMYIFLGLIAIVVPYILRAQKPDYGVYRFMTLFGNVGFMGYPVIGAIFGQGAIFYTVLFNIPFNLLSYSLGIMLLSSGKGIDGAGSGFKFDYKLLINAPLIASFISVALCFLNIDYPQPLVEATTSLGDMTTPGAMLILGSTLAMQPLKKVFGDWHAYGLTFIRLIIIPCAAYLIFRNIVADELLLGILVVVSGMPVATNATMLTMEYGGNLEVASKTVVLSTILSVVSIPLMVYVLLI